MRLTVTRAAIIGAIGIAAIALIVVITLSLTPEQSSPAFDAAVTFTNAAGEGDDAVAIALVSPDLRAYIERECPQGSVSACVRTYTPPAWGTMASAVYRRAVPDGATAWDVELISYYDVPEAVGASGVCIYNRVEQIDGAWRVTRWGGFVHCAEPGARAMATNPETPHRAP